MGLNIGSIFGKAFRWLVPRIVDEVQQEIDRRTHERNVEKFGIPSSDPFAAVPHLVAKELRKREGTP